MRAAMFRDQTFIGYRWLFLCKSDDLEAVIAADQKTVGEVEVRGLAIAAAYWAAMLR